MGKLEDTLKRCVAASTALDARMFTEGRVSLRLSAADKAAILSEIESIHQQFETLVTADDDACTPDMLADIYFEWGAHYKQAAWFHYGFAKQDSRELHAAIEANKAAIDKLAVAAQSYTTKKAQRQTHSLIAEYQENAKVLQDDLRLHAKSASSDVSDSSEIKRTETSVLTRSPKKKKKVSHHTLTLDAVLDSIKSRHRGHAAESRALSEQMFDREGHVRIGITLEAKSDILRAADAISQNFEALAFEMQAVPLQLRCSEQLASLYFDWGTHYKQQARFHYAFVNKDLNALEEAIGLNQDAIEKMKTSFNLHTSLDRKAEVQALITRYQADDKRLTDEFATTASATTASSSTSTMLGKLLNQPPQVSGVMSLPTLKAILSINTTDLTPATNAPASLPRSFPPSEYARRKFKMDKYPRTFDFSLNNQEAASSSSTSENQPLKPHTV